MAHSTPLSPSRRRRRRRDLAAARRRRRHVRPQRRPRRRRRLDARRPQLGLQFGVRGRRGTAAGVGRATRRIRGGEQPAKVPALKGADGGRPAARQRSPNESRSLRRPLPRAISAESDSRRRVPESSSRGAALDAAGSQTRRSAVSKSSGTRGAAAGFGAAGFTADGFAVAAGFTIDGFAVAAGLCGTRGFGLARFGMERSLCWRRGRHECEPHARRARSSSRVSHRVT